MNVTSVAVPTACWLNVAACVNAAIVTASERDIATADTAGLLNATVYVEESDAAAAEAIVKPCNSISHGVWAARVAVLILKQTPKSPAPALPAGSKISSKKDRTDGTERQLLYVPLRAHA